MTIDIIRWYDSADLAQSGPTCVVNGTRSRQAFAIAMRPLWGAGNETEQSLYPIYMTSQKGGSIGGTMWILIYWIIVSDGRGNAVTTGQAEYATYNACKRAHDGLLAFNTGLGATRITVTCTERN